MEEGNVSGMSDRLNTQEDLECCAQSFSQIFHKAAVCFSLLFPPAFCSSLHLLNSRNSGDNCSCPAFEQQLDGCSMSRP